MDKTKEGWNQGREVGIAGVGGDVGGKGRKLYLNNNKKFLKAWVLDSYILLFLVLL